MQRVSGLPESREKPQGVRKVLLDATSEMGISVPCRHPWRFEQHECMLGTRYLAVVFAVIDNVPGDELRLRQRIAFDGCTKLASGREISFANVARA